LKEKSVLEKTLDEKMDRWAYLNELNEKIQESKKHV
jgi:ATP-binding cassette subfamily F protein uup